MKVHEKHVNGTVEVLTKGDNNRVDDRGLYAPGQLWLQREDILGRAKGTLRYVDCHMVKHAMQCSMLDIILLCSCASDLLSFNTTY